VELTRQLVNEGETAGTDLRRLEVEAGLAESSRASLERELTTTRGLVALQLGLAPDSLEIAPLRELFPPNAAPDLTIWQSLALTHRPELLRDRAELDRLTLEQQVADAEGRSSLTYSVFVESTEAETTAGAGLTIPLKQGGNGTRATQQSIARRHEALTEALQLRETQVTAEIAVHFAAVQAARAQVAELEAVVVPAADAALATALFAWREGEGSLLNYLDAQRQRLSINESLLDGEAALMHARGELLLAAGLTTWPEDTTP
jgi:cobalt-zinc-cadmium efflux system outer membrane protein